MDPVENKPGPRPARTAGGRLLSPTRAALLETLQAQPEPTSLPALVAVTGLHANTVREHLDGLRRAGLVVRTPAPPSGPRPTRQFGLGSAPPCPGRRPPSSPRPMLRHGNPRPWPRRLLWLAGFPLES